MGSDLGWRPNLRSTGARSMNGGLTTTGHGSTGPGSVGRSVPAATYITTAAVYLMIGPRCLSADPMVALALGAGFASAVALRCS